MSGRTRFWLVLCGLLLGFALWSLPSMAQETSGDTPVLVLTVGSRSCTLAPIVVEETATAEVSAVPRATYRPTLTPIPTTPSADETEAPAQGFASGTLVVLTLSDDCANLLSQLQVPENGVLWLSLSLQDDPDSALPLSSLADDDFPPQLDRRGRYFGCSIPDQGEQVCRVVVTVGEVSYQIDVPVTVEGAFVAPTSTAAPSAPEPTTAPVSNPQPQPPASTEQP
ncbi:MAG: hypothetical protein U0694_22680 [Anaerolineae bacterium]